MPDDLRARLPALAAEEARRRHLACADADGFGTRDGHEERFPNCLHPDCRLVREAALLRARLGQFEVSHAPTSACPLSGDHSASGCRELAALLREPPAAPSQGPDDWPFDHAPHCNVWVETQESYHMDRDRRLAQVRAAALRLIHALIDLRWYGPEQRLFCTICRSSHENILHTPDCPVRALHYAIDEGEDTAAPKGDVIIRIRYQQQGGHYHCRVFTAKAVDHTFGKCGELVFDEREWEAVCAKLHPACEFIEEERTHKEFSRSAGPRCYWCERSALQDHLTCGRIECSESDARRDRDARDRAARAAVPQDQPK